MKTLEKFRINVAPVSESRILESWSLDLENYHVIYSGKERTKTAGVTPAFSGAEKKCLLDWGPINYCILRARFMTT